MSKIPNLLTIFRLVSLPFLIAMFFFQSDLWKWLAFILFSISAITDFLDGYLARKLNLETALGGIFDPIADKLLVACVLVAIMMRDSNIGIAYKIGFPVIVIIAREIIVSGLREFLATIRVKLILTRVAKIKTLAQLVSISFLIVGSAGPTFFGSITTTDIGIFLLWFATLLTLYSGYDYAVKSWPHIPKM